jgi:cysteine desulfurase
MYGPKGIGALYIRSQNPRVNLEAIYHGGHQERGLRPGTLNVPSIVGFGLACKICEAQGADDRIHVSSLRDFFLEKIKEISENISLNGSIEHRLANNLHLSFGEIEAENLIHRLKTIALSTGAACASGKRSPSHVLKAMGLENSAIHSSIRFGLGRFTTLQEIESATAQIAVAVHSLEEKTHG